MKKVLSFVLVLALVLSSFSMAFAGTTATAGLSDIDGNVNEEAIQVANDLGIVTGNPDGTFQPEKAVNRAEFAAMVTRALGVPESALAGYTATSFKDTSGYGWAVPYLAFCDSKGIMLGDGAGNAMPGKTISVNEAMTMVLRALGYTNNSSVLVGTWPSNYVTLAQDLDLYDTVAATSTVDKANAAQIIYNALTAAKVQVAADGATTEVGTWDTTVVPNVWYAATMLTSGLNCEVRPAEVITGEEDSLINLGKYVGAYVIAYENDDDEIVAIGEVKSTFLTGNFDDSEDEFEVGDVTYKMANATEAAIAKSFVNNSDQNSLPGINGGGDLDDVTIAVELNGKTIKTIYSVNAWDITKGDAAIVDKDDLEEIESDQKLLGQEFVLDDDDEIDMDSFVLVGAKSLADIKVDNVVYVFNYDTGHENAGKIAKIAVGTEVVEGTISDYDAGDSGYLDATYTIGGKDYEFQRSYNINAEYDALSGTNNGVGDTYKFYLDFQGRIFEAEEIESTPDTYGVVTYYATSGIDDAKLKMYTSDDTTKTFLVDEDTEDEINNGSLIAAGAVANVLVGYSLDKDGVIDGIDQTVTTAAAGAKIGTKTFTLSGGATSYTFADTVAVFTIDASGDLDIAKLGELEDTLTSGSAYILNEDNELVALLVDAVDAGASADDTFAVFNKSVVTYDATQDENVDKVSGFFDGTAATKNANDEGIVTSGAVNAIGSLYKVDFDADGYIKAITAVTDGGDSGNWVVKGDLTSATAISDLAKSKTVVTLTGGAASYELEDDVVVYEYDADDEEYKLSKVSALRVGYSIILYNTDAKDSDDDGYDVVIFQRP